MNSFFRNCFSESDFKQRYRELAKVHHPDRGGDEEMFKALVSEYERIKAYGNVSYPQPTYATRRKEATVWGRVKRRNAINRLLKIQQSKCLKKMFVYYAYLDKLKEEGQQLTILDLELIAAALEYKPGWVNIKAEELNLK